MPTTTQTQGGIRTVRRACLACRNAKTKCIFPNGADICLSCQKSGQSCLSSGLRKPRSTSSQKFKALETKVNELAHALTEERNIRQSASYGRNGDGHEAVGGPTPVSIALQDDWSPSEIGDGAIPDLLTTDQDRMLFQHWESHMHPNIPFISLPDGSTYHKLRSHQPATFLAILTAASSVILPEASKLLASKLLEKLAYLAHIKHETSLDLIQSLLLYHCYPVPIDDGAPINVQHAYTAAIMSHDLGLDKAKSSDPGGKGVDHDSLIAARLWSAAYFATSTSSCLLGRQKLAVDRSGVDGAMSRLCTDMADNKADATLCALVEFQTIIEDASQGYGDVGAPYPREFTQILNYQLSSLEDRLQHWSQTHMAHVEEGHQAILFHTARLRIHHVAIVIFLRNAWSTGRIDHSASARPKAPLNANHAKSLEKCQQSSQSILQGFADLEARVLRSFPTIQFIWALIAAIALAKMAPLLEHDIGSSASVESSATIALYRRVILKLEEVCEDGHVPQVQSFLQAFRKLGFLYARSKSVCLSSRSLPGTNETGMSEVLLGGDDAMTRPSATSVATSTGDHTQADEREGRNGQSASLGTVHQAVVTNQPHEEMPVDLDLVFPGADFSMEEMMSSIDDWANIPFEDNLMGDGLFPGFLFPN